MCWEHNIRTGDAPRVERPIIESVKSARVLVVDDERPIIDIVLRALAQRGHRGTGAGFLPKPTDLAEIFALIEALPEKP